MLASKNYTSASPWLVLVNAPVLLALTACIFSTLAIYFVQSNADFLNDIGFSGLFVPDAISLRDSLEVYWGGVIDDGSWEQWRTMIGVMIIYVPGIVFGEMGFLLVNLSLLSISFSIFVKTLKKLGILVAPVYIALISFGNIYLIEVFLYPNKEIPLLFTTTLFSWFLFVKKSLWGVVFSVALAFMFRDGYGMILILAATFVYFARNLPGKDMLIFSFIIMIGLSIFPISLFYEVDYSFRRNVPLDSSYSYLISGQYGYFFRIIGNSFNLGARPQFFDCNHNLYFLSVGFWQFGVLVIAGILWALKGLIQNNLKSKKVAVLIIFVLLGVSYSSFVQPRYLMPLIYFFSMAFAMDRRCAFIAIGISIVGPVFFLLINQLPPCA